MLRVSLRADWNGLFVGETATTSDWSTTPAGALWFAPLVRRVEALLRYMAATCSRSIGPPFVPNVRRSPTNTSGSARRGDDSAQEYHFIDRRSTRFAIPAEELLRV